MSYENVSDVSKNYQWRCYFPGKLKSNKSATALTMGFFLEMFQSNLFTVVQKFINWTLF